MKITSISASNFLSFGTDGKGLHLDCLRPFTILVGPNGAGKTNVLRVVQAITKALAPTGTRPGANELERLVNRLVPEASQLRLEIGIRFDSERERTTIHAFWLNAMAYPESNTLNFIIQKDGKTRGVSPDPARLRELADWVLQHATQADVQTLFEGKIVLQIDLLDSYPTVELSYECGCGDDAMVIELGGRKAPESSWRFPASGPPKRSQPALSAMIDALPEAQRQEFGGFLEGGDTHLPPLPSLGLTCLAKASRIRSGWFTARLPDENGYRVYSDDQAPQARMRLNEMLGRALTDRSRLDAADVFRYLVHRAIVCYLDWDVRSEQSLDEDPGLSADPVIDARNLAIYLLRLKNGSGDEHARFNKIQKDFHRFVGASLDVRLEVKQAAAQQGDGASSTSLQHMATVVTDYGIPLKYGGSGRTRAALVVALIHHHDSTILLLDEPEAHLHPALTRELAGRLMRRDEQTLVVTHSPYMIPAGALASARRVVSLPSSPSVVSGSITDEAVTSLNLKKRPAYTEDSMFLFSWCTVFVEGPNEAAALPVWFDKWCSKRCDGPHAGERLGVRFQSAGGANAVLPWLQTAKAFSVPCLGLYDADVLKADHGRKQDSNSVPKQWQTAGLLRSVEEMPWGKDKGLSVIHERDTRIFFTGVTTTDDFEALPVCQQLQSAAVDATGGGPLAYRWIAEQTEPPSEFNALFEAARECAERAKGACPREA